MADILRKVTSWGIKAIPLVLGLMLFVNTNSISFLPGWAHQVIGGVLVVAGVMAIAKK